MSDYQQTPPPYGDQTFQQAPQLQQAMDPQLVHQPSTAQSWFNFSNSGYLKGFVIGAGVALVLGNPTVQKSIVSGAVKCWSALQGGVEEVKEKVKDIKAEISSKD